MYFKWGSIIHNRTVNSEDKPSLVASYWSCWRWWWKECVCSSSPWSEWMQRAVTLESGVMVVIRGVPVAYRVCLFLTLGEVVEMLPVENEQVWHKWETCQEVHRCSAGVKKERHRERRARVNKWVLLEHHADVQQPQLIDAFKAPYQCPLSCPQTLFAHLCFLSPSQHLKYHIYGWRIGF